LKVPLSLLRQNHFLLAWMMMGGMQKKVSVGRAGLS
jgi:hypothetical protein